jgi:hypothetical protein
MVVTEYITITDEDGNSIIQNDFGRIERGNITLPLILVLNNISGLDLNLISIIPTLSLFQQGEIYDTIKSTFISTDGENYFQEANISIQNGGKQKIYIKWQPRWMANIRKYRWTLEVDIQEADGEELC